MKTTLLSALLLLGLAGFSQTPIASYYGEDNVAYLLGEPVTTLDQTAAGANVNWNFNFNMAGASIHSIGTISSTELASFPGSTYEEDIVWSPIADVPSESSIFSKHPSNTVSLTGFRNSTIELNLVTDNALIGTFPMNFGASVNDPIAGTYKYDTYNGTFTGTSVTTVDAYGTLTVNIGNIPAGSSVTRLKTVQNISLFYSPFPSSVGTASQITYSYYGHNGMNAPLMRTTSTTFNVPLLGVNESGTDIEVFDNMALATTQFSAEQLQVQNPMGNALNIRANGMAVTTVTLTDLAGKVVLQSAYSDMINVSALQKGIYVLTLQTDRGVHTQKIMKN